MADETVPETTRKSIDDLLQACKGISGAMTSKDVGAIAQAHEEMILHYYKDVQNQANQSFRTACRSAQWGFLVLISTVVVVVGVDILGRIPNLQFMAGGSSAVATVGLVSGALIEGIAGIAFWLYSKGARQFGAFHICLERTYRYLLAYKIAEQSGVRKEDTIRDLVCIMANAPMITHADIDSDLPLPQARSIRRPLGRVTGKGSTELS
jgi:hypothetical protein